MSADSTKGKLTNKDSGAVLGFSLNPHEVSMSRQFHLAVEPMSGFSAPMVAFRCGGATSLEFKVKFDKDADSSCDPNKVESFLKSLNQINASTQSAPKVEFRLGQILFIGFVESYQTLRSRFDDKADTTSLTLTMKLISTGEYENEKS